LHGPLGPSLWVDKVPPSFICLSVRSAAGVFSEGVLFFLTKSYECVLHSFVYCAPPLAVSPHAFLKVLPLPGWFSHLSLFLTSLLEFYLGGRRAFPRGLVAALFLLTRLKPPLLFPVSLRCLRYWCWEGTMVLVFSPFC